MRPSLDWKTLAGSAALLAALLLASPGVRVVRAADDAVAVGPAPQCQGAPAAPAAELSATLEQARRQLQAQRAADGHAGGEDVVVLNNRGYNYGPPPDVDPSALLRELTEQ